MNNTCQSITCPATPVLLPGIDAYATDQIQFIGLGFGPLTPPPLGWSFDRATAFSIYKSNISQDDANSQAFIDASHQAEKTWLAPGQQAWIPPTTLPPPDWELPADLIEWVPPLT